MGVGRRRAILLAAMLTVALMYFALPSVARWWAERRLAAASGLVTRIAALEPTWDPLGIALGGVELRVAAGGPPLLSVDRMELPLRGGRLRLIGPVLSLRAGSEGGAGSPQERSPERRFALADAELLAPAIEVFSSRGAPETATSFALPDILVEHLSFAVLSEGGGFAATGRVGLAGGSLDGRVRLRARGEPRIAAELRLTGLDAARLGALAASYGLEAGQLGGRLRYRRDADGGSERVRGRLWARGMRSVDGPGGWQLDAGDLELRGLDLDLAAHRFAVRRTALVGGELTLANRRDAAAARAPAGVWTGSVEVLDVRDLVVRSDAVAGLPSLRLVSLLGRDLGLPTGTFTLRARPTSGGEIRADGELDAAAPRFRAGLEIDHLEVGPWIEPFARRLRVASGSLGGRFEISGPPGVQGSGELRLEGLRASARTAGEERELAQLGSLSVSLRGFTLSPPRVWLTSAEIDAPALVFTRGAQGLEPLSLLAGEDAPEDEVAAREAFAGVVELLGEAPPLSLPSIEVKARIRDGRLRFVDEAVSPRFAIELDGVGGTLAAWGGPPWGTVRAEVEGRVDGAASLAARAEISGQRFVVGGEVASLPLAPWNPYLAPTIGYAATAGRASAAFELEWERAVRAPTRIALEDVVLERKQGEDRLGAMLGMPLEHALELMTDSGGRSELVLRLEGDAGAPALGLIAALPAALREAVPEAVSVPLFEGAELVGGEDVEHVRLAPLPFPPGEAEIPPQRFEALERLAVVLRWDPVLVATVQGLSGAEDASALPRGSGEKESLDRLAARRAEAIRARLVDALGIAADRVRVVPAASGAPGARIEVRPGEETP